MLDPKAFAGTRVNWTGKVVAQPDVYETYIAFQATNSEVDELFIVGTGDLSIKSWMVAGSYVRVIGDVVDEFRGTNRMGAEITAPVIKAALVSKMRRADAEAPALSTVTYGKNVSQFGFDVRLDRVELASTETRIYVTLSNHRPGRVRFFTYGAKLVKGSEQFDDKFVLRSDEELPDELLPGVEVSGAVVFPGIPGGVSGARLYLGTPSPGGPDAQATEVVFTL